MSREQDLESALRYVRDTVAQRIGDHVWSQDEFNVKMRSCWEMLLSYCDNALGIKTKPSECKHPQIDGELKCKVCRKPGYWDEGKFKELPIR